MSNALAIATATATLGQIVLTAAQGEVPAASLSNGRPENPPAGSPSARIHIYLYQVTPNAAWRNTDLPTRSGDGKLVQRPQVALDLHYVIVFYGNDTELEPQRMLGAVVRDLHARPMLTREMIRGAITGQPILTSSDLADSVELVKFTPLSLSLEELSKLWSVFFQTQHALSVAYQGTVVLIESEEGASLTLPVLQRGQDDRGVDTVLGPFPALTEIHIGALEDAGLGAPLPSYPSARLGDVLTLGGSNLGGDTLRVRFTHPRLTAANELVIPQGDRTATGIRFTLPNDAAAQTDWAAGIYTVTVIAKDGDTERTTNSLPLPLAPRILAITPPNPVTPGPGRNVTLSIQCSPRVLLTQTAMMFLADRAVAAQPRAAVTDPLTLVVNDAPVVNDAVVRLRVDDVDSLPFIRTADTPPRLVFDGSQKVTIT